MRARTFLAPLFMMAASVVSGTACSQTPVVVPLRSMERPHDVDFICLADTGHGTWKGVSLENCASTFDGKATNDGPFRLHAVVTQQSRGELAVVDLGRVPTDAAVLTKADPRLPGYSFIPVGAAPTDVVADPMGSAVFVSSGRDPRIDVLPSELLRGPIDTAASSQDPPPWPHIDFLPTEGIPSAMAIVREGNARRLYVTLPEATPSAKIAVFDLPSSDAGFVVPVRVGDIPLGAPAASPLPTKTLGCGPAGTGEPWWAAYDRCAGEAPRIPGGSVTAAATTDHHLAGVAVAGGKMFVADDHAEVIHVYDINSGAGVEIRQIAIGGKTSRLAVSPVVPDAVTNLNSAAIDICNARGWIGDGLDHSADSSTVATQLGGRCRAHRYVYAIDLVNDEAGNGSIAIVDVPVTFALDDKNQIKLRAGTDPKDAVPAEERLDIDGAELVQPMACDAPTFPARRLPLGVFGLNGLNVVPARSISFIEIDPPKTADEKFRAVRCRPKDTPAGADEFQGVPDAEKEARTRIGYAWSDGVSPRRMRGVYAWVALSNGAVVLVDIDDYDSTCRGPEKITIDRPAVRTFLYPGPPAEQPISLGEPETTRATDEYYMHPVQRHHPRSLRLFDDTLVPAVSSVTFSRFDSIISNDPASDQGRIYPHFTAFRKRNTDEPRPPVVMPAPDNPYAVTNEVWAVTYEGTLPGFTGNFGALNADGGALALSDPAGSFCHKGVESNGAVETHDVVQLTDEMCQFDSCTPTAAQQCSDYFGDTAQQPFKPTRSLIIDKAFDNRLTLANKHWERTTDKDNEAFVLADGPAKVDLIRQCFGSGLLKYTVRTAGNWVVIGSVSGYVHRQIVDPTSTDKACILDPSQPRIHSGRVFELPPINFSTLKDPKNPLEDDSSLVADNCQLFINSAWKFAIRSGTGKSAQDMRFTFTGRFSWQPFNLASGSLTSSMRSVAGYWDGQEHLGWNMMAVVDAVDRGLLMFPANEPFSYQKGAN